MPVDSPGRCLVTWPGNDLESPAASGDYVSGFLSDFAADALTLVGGLAATVQLVAWVLAGVRAAPTTRAGSSSRSFESPPWWRRLLLEATDIRGFLSLLVSTLVITLATIGGWVVSGMAWQGTHWPSTLATVLLLWAGFGAILLITLVFLLDMARVGGFDLNQHHRPVGAVALLMLLSGPALAAPLSSRVEPTLYELLLMVVCWPASLGGFFLIIPSSLFLVVDVFDVVMKPPST